MSVISKAEAEAYMNRWTAVREVELEELRNTSISEKLRQTEVLMQAAREWGLPLRDADEETKVREIWNRLREVLHE